MLSVVVYGVVIVVGGDGIDCDDVDGGSGDYVVVVVVAWWE